METEYSTVTNNKEQTPSWDRYHETFRQIYGAREDQQHSNRWLIMENLDTMSFDAAFEHYKSAFDQAVNNALTQGRRYLDWDVLQAFRDIANDIDLRFTNAKDSHTDAARKRIAGGQEQAFKSFLTSALDALRKTLDSR